MAANKKDTSLVRVFTPIKKKVEKKVDGTNKSIGQYYDEAVEEKMKRKKR